jgi:hypothetical protein
LPPPIWPEFIASINRPPESVVASSFRFREEELSDLLRHNGYSVCSRIIPSKVTVGGLQRHSRGRVEAGEM